jgi:hypothetical protein
LTLSQTLPADGTILVTTSPFTNPSSSKAIVEVNSTTGAQSVLTSGGLLSGPIDIREAPDDTLYVDDYGAQTTGAIIAVDPSTGAQRLVASGGCINNPGSLQYMKGRIFVTDNPAAAPPNLVSVDPSTGKQKLISQGGSFVFPIALQPGPANSIYVVDYSADVTGAIFQVDLHTGAQTLIASGGYLNKPVDVATDPSGNLVVIQDAGGGAPGLGSIVSVNPRTGGQTLISAGGLLTSSLNGNSVDRAGDIFVSSYASPASIIEVNPSTGAQSVLTTGGYLDFASGSVVFYHNQGSGFDRSLDAATANQGSVAVANDPGIVLSVALATNHKKVAQTAMGSPES